MQEGIALHAALQYALPAHRDEYRTDFREPASAREFDTLLALPSNVFELDGQRDGQWLQPAAYSTAGHIVTGHCDLLLAIWDGKSGDEGGTAQVVREALRAGIPIIRIHVDNPETVEFSPEGADSQGLWRAAWQPLLGEFLRNSLNPPPSAEKWLPRYTKERIESQTDLQRADALSVRYGKYYRRSYHVKYWLSAIAVFFAVAGLMPRQDQRRLWPFLEFVCIAGVLLWFFRALLGDWHERWINYRMLAEQFRVLDFLAPLGQTVPLFRPPVFWNEPSRHAWVGWYFRARLRQRGMPNKCVTPEYLRKQRGNLMTVVEDQIEYHKGKHESTRLSHRLTHYAGPILFGVTALACIAHFRRMEIVQPYVLGAITAALPALAAALEGLQAQAEWHRLSERSERMQKHIESLKKRLPETPGPTFAALSAVAVDLAEAMTSETSEWHNLIHGKPLNLG